MANEVAKYKNNDNVVTNTMTNKLLSTRIMTYEVAKHKLMANMLLITRTMTN